MNLTDRPIYQKIPKETKKRKPMRKFSEKRAKQRASREGKRGQEYMRQVKQLPCCICAKPGPSDAHHPICDRYGTRKASDFDTIPLCRECHLDGPNAIHNGKQTWREKHGPDHSYIKSTRLRIDPRYWPKVL
tara:strand:- start:389 stop:784 length:396 start_codon:yes stop_codon:yes gene_type:complete